MIEYLICGEWDDSEGSFPYWNSELGWTSFENATRFGFDVFMQPLPRGGASIIELNHGRIAGTYVIVPIIPPPPRVGDYSLN
jgi:hypothetical protein